MPRPVEKVHVDQRCVCKLDKEYLVTRYGTDRIRVDLAAECMETVKDQSDMTMVGTAHHFPRVTMIIDMPSPGQRLKPNSQPPRLCPLAKLGEIISSPVNATKRVGRQVRANQNKIGAHAVHQVEFSFCPVESS